ncbi:MAG TPA: DNA polymerase IV, partial [Chromatiales bacterium]|nr:DNA polymerase IV [Chromatiales bacterium]
PPDTRDRHTLLIYLLHMSEKIGARLRRHEMQAQRFSVGLLGRDGWIGDRFRTVAPTDDGRVIYQMGRQLLRRIWAGEGIRQVRITALDPRPADDQRLLFATGLPDRRAGNRVMDAINRRYGEFALAPARLLHRSDMPNVIAPAWKPFGHRETIGYREPARDDQDA